MKKRSIIFLCILLIGVIFLAGCDDDLGKSGEGKAADSTQTVEEKAPEVKTIEDWTKANPEEWKKWKDIVEKSNNDGADGVSTTELVVKDNELIFNMKLTQTLEANDAASFKEVLDADDSILDYMKQMKDEVSQLTGINCSGVKVVALNGDGSVITEKAPTF